MGNDTVIKDAARVMLGKVKTKWTTDWHHCKELRSEAKAKELAKGIEAYLAELNSGSREPAKFEKLEGNVPPTLNKSSLVEKGFQSMVTVLVGTVDFFAYLKIDLFSQDKPKDLGPTESLMLLLGTVNPIRKIAQR